MKYLLIGLAVFVGTSAIWFFFFRLAETPALIVGENSKKIVYINASEDLIKVSSPLPGTVVGRNFSVTGDARGTWFFEASFPVSLIGKNGEILAQTAAQAKGEWMTENFVPFQVDIKVPKTYTGPATLVLKKDNPSALAEHDASISFDVVI